MAKIKSEIFGSPAHPEFGSDEHVPAELLEEHLRSLAEKNEEFLSKATIEDGTFSEGVCAELVFNITKKLNLPIEVKYVAVEIFDKFMCKHISELYAVVKTSSCKEKKLDWDCIEARIKDQLQLRAASCIQVASKLVSHYDALSPSKIKRYLASCNLQYSKNSVIKSEMRVLDTLDFHLNFTSPLTYVELLLEVLGRNCPGLEVSMIYDVSVKLLDITYLQKVQLCKRLSEAAVTEFDIKRASDYFLTAVCVVVAAAFIIDSGSNDLFIEQVSLITCVDEADIILFATVLVKLAFDP